MNMAGKPMIRHVIDRVREIRSVDALVVAIPQAGNGPLAAKLNDWGVSCFPWSGPCDDVLGRFVAAAESIRWINPNTRELDPVEYVVRVCGDSPLIDSQSTDELVVAAVLSKADYTGYRFKDGAPAISRPTGYFTEVVKMSALKRANDELPRNAKEREHVTACMYAEDQSRFRPPFSVRWLDVPTWYAKEKLKNAAVDTREDFERVKAVVEKE